MTTPAQRTTKQRLAVAASLENSEAFRTAQQIHDALRDCGQSVGLSTVYRTLQAMAAAGEVDVVRRPDGEATYRRCVSNHHHHHLVCRECGTTVEVAGEVVERWAAEVAREFGFTEVDHGLELFGLCRECSAAD